MSVSVYVTGCSHLPDLRHPHHPLSVQLLQTQRHSRSHSVCYGIQCHKRMQEVVMMQPCYSCCTFLLVAGPGHSSVSLECLELDWEDSTHPRLRSGPWSCRYMHPTTTLIHYLPPSQQPAANSSTSTSIAQGGLLAVSSRSLILITSPTQSQMVAAACSSDAEVPDTADGIRKVELLQYTLAGIPTCLTVLDDSHGAAGSSASGGLLLAVADTMAGAATRLMCCVACACR